MALARKELIFDLFKTFRKKLEEEISKLKGKISNKDEEFTRTADGLERELEAVRDQMKQSQKDRDRTLKDKETLLEEVKYIVGQESKPCNSDFCVNDFLSMREYQAHGAHSVKFLQF